MAEVLAGFGPHLVRACSISAGQRVLDVGAGIGNVAIPAAATGAAVVACDLSLELFDPGRRDAAARGYDWRGWRPTPRRCLRPFADDEFDVVTSAVGVIFGPRPIRPSPTSCRGSADPAG